MKISEVAKATHLPISTIRYYERKGLISKDYFIRNENGFRDYFPSAVSHLRFISRLLSNGFSIAELLQISNTYGSCPTSEGNIQVLKKKITEVQRKILELEESEKILKRMLANKEKNRPSD